MSAENSSQKETKGAKVRRLETPLPVIGRQGFFFVNVPDKIFAPGPVPKQALVEAPRGAGLAATDPAPADGATPALPGGAEDGGQKSEVSYGTEAKPDHYEMDDSARGDAHPTMTAEQHNMFPKGRY